MQKLSLYSYVYIALAFWHHRCYVLQYLVWFGIYVIHIIWCPKYGNSDIHRTIEPAILSLVQAANTSNVAFDHMVWLRILWGLKDVMLLEVCALILVFPTQYEALSPAWCLPPGADPGFSEGGVWTQKWIPEVGGLGAQPPRSYRVLHFWSMKIASRWLIYI